MRLNIAALTLASLFLVACQNTEFRFGDPQPTEVGAMHNDLGNTHENIKVDPLMPISENEHLNIVPSNAESKPLKIVQPKRPKLEQIAQPAPIAAPVPEQAPSTAAAPSANWQPNEALIIRGRELLTGLQKEIGKKPSITEMQKRLKTHMGLSAEQSQQLIAILGL
ncbi:MAG TPA: hypothetical protein VLG38_08305 [Gammaproteobacteria bacterium]|nr:hypothetical protein [Gammaproteobacteria bacterium]